MDSRTAAKLAKLANLATSDNREEADSAARGAVALLRKSGTTLEAYLGEADPGAVFQLGLVRVADAYVADLAPTERRARYAELLARISRLYSGRRAEESAREEALRKREDEIRRRERAAAAGSAGTGPAAPGAEAQSEPPPRDRRPGGSGGTSGRKRERPSFSPAEGGGTSAAKPRGPDARTLAAGVLFGAFAGVSGTVVLAAVFGAAGGAPAWLAELPVAAVALGIACFGGAARVWAESRPEVKALFSKFP